MNEDPNHGNENLSPEQEAELQRFAQEQAKELGLHREQYTEKVYSNAHFTASQVAHTTLLVSGLTIAHDTLIVAGLNGLGYRVEMLDLPDNAALQVGKEFGNRAQCNPTYFTVGNLVKHLIALRDEKGIPATEIVANYAFLTAGACGPCRFGMYVTEYRKALRDAGFDGFRVLLFQQQGGIKQATGEAVGLKINAAFAAMLVRAVVAGDVLNLMGYRMRPYEVRPGETDRAIAECKRVLVEHFRGGKAVLPALVKCRMILGKVELDRSQPKPVVSVIGEFWAMTTEGDGNYHLQRFLEQEGAEVDIQGITNWLLFMLWENRHDTRLRMELKGEDTARKGLSGKDPAKKMAGLAVGEVAIRALFQTYAKAIGLHGYHLPDMERIATLAAEHYDLQVRGGEAHMEVGKLAHFVEDKVNHMTLSVKPFGCMPSSGVSDGVQARLQGKYPDAIFLPLETTGDGKVNAQSRVQMMLFKARQKARAELEQALEQAGIDEATFQERARKSKRWSSVFARPKGQWVGQAANLAAAMG